MSEVKRNRKAGDLVMKKNFDVLKKQTRFYILLIALVVVLVGLIFKGIYSIQYNNTYTEMGNESEYTFTDINGKAQIKTIYPHQVEARMKENNQGFIMELKGIGYLMMVIGGFAILFSGMACGWTMLPEKYKAGKDDVDISNIRTAVECPYCHSTNTKKISTANRMVSTGMFGLASKKIGKQWHCNKCGSDF